MMFLSSGNKPNGLFDLELHKTYNEFLKSDKSPDIWILYYFHSHKTKDLAQVPIPVKLKGTEWT